MADSKTAELGHCPICGKPTVRAFRPFCSKRCANVDLGRWLGEGYRIAENDPHAPIEVVEEPDRND